MQKLLEQSGCTVILTRSDENAIYDIEAKTLKQKKISDIHNRVKIGNEAIVGMGSMVFRDLEDGVTVVGNPARVTKGNSEHKVFRET